MTGQIADKRFKVVQDAWGVWGILDTVALEFGVEPFAGWEGVANVYGAWMGDIVGWAIALNTREDERDVLDWSEYDPREVSA